MKFFHKQIKVAKKVVQNLSAHPKDISPTPMPTPYERVLEAPYHFESCMEGSSCLSFNVIQERALLQGLEQKPSMCLQDGETEEDRYTQQKAADALFTMMNSVAPSINKWLSKADSDWFLYQLENFSQLLLWSTKCDTLADYISLSYLAFRLFTGKPVGVYVKHKIMEIFEPNVQGFTPEETLKTLREAFDMGARVQQTPLVRKLVSLYSFLLTQGFLRKFGFSITDEDFSKMEQRALLSAYSSKKSFFACVIDTSLFVCEKLLAWRETGDISVFVHDSDQYTAWMKESEKILNLAPFVSNLAAHGTDYFSWLSTLRDLIEKGEAYEAYIRSSAGVSSEHIKRRLASLNLCYNVEVTRRAAQKERSAPFGVLIHGTSSIGKSAFTKMLFNYYGALFDLERDDQYRYVRNPMEEYWSNFDSSKWCIQLDDIAFLLPKKCSEVDLTLKDMLNVINNVPYVPPQAALEDKGKTPVMARLVLATSNTYDLNAAEYFHCPLAVRRRLPFIVKLVPKKQFLHANKKFLDSSKVIVENGKFPDFWDITVQELVPINHNGHDDASLRVDKVFTDVNKFLQYFGEACKAHEATQARAMAKDKDMLTISVCKVCCLPLPHEGDCASMEVQYGCTTWLLCLWMWLLDYFFRIKYLMRALKWLAQYRVLRSVTCEIVNRCPVPDIAVDFFGDLVAMRHDPRMQKVLLCLSALSVALATYGAITYMTPSESKPRKKEEKDVDIQGNVYGTTETQLEKEETANVWYTPDLRLTSFDVPVSSASLAGASADTIRSLFDRNCVLLHIRGHGLNSTRIMRGVFIRGQQCLTNAHAFRQEADTFDVTVIMGNRSQGLNPNLTFTIKRRDISLDSKSEVCMFEVLSLPPFKDITGFWNDAEINPTSGLELIREDDGTLSKNPIFAVSLVDFAVEELGGHYDVYFGKSSVPTETGMCGSIFIATTPRGPIICGLHMLGKGNDVGFVSVSLTTIERVAEKFSSRPVVQGGGEPVLSCADKKYVLSVPHHRSMFRYLETGTLNIYGSFSGFRPKPRSKVCATPLQDVFLEHFGREVEYGPPVMAGWEPWRKNVVEMVKPNSTYDRAVLRDCTDSFLADILQALPEGWERDIVRLSDKAAVNGLPGVKYIDKLATSTSMGHPWCCTKKKYLFEDKCQIYPDGVNFDPEIWERVRVIEQKYAQGVRAFTVFTGHLKDEAVPLAKILAKKTRLFVGGPADWNIVVRKELLSFVRLVQKNKFVFEAGPGTVCQSLEWTRIHDYLTQFGSDRIVAGDYGKFDKRMLADFILAAFDIIVGVHRKAGYSEEEVRVLMCIGYDIAFPLTNVNGDLVEFFGTNPSGHPLTVIVNSLVNSLYMRYCYHNLNPRHETLTFKSNVSLFTYGDDNVMGVSARAPFFNHTAIQAVLGGIGVEYTMADKESASVPYVSLYDCSFLKREWLWSDEVGAWLCPLSEESIIKSLTVWTPSDSIDKWKQMVSVISSANFEYFSYGREKFEVKRAFFEKLLKEEPYSHYVAESTLPDYDTLVERFHRASKALHL